MGAWVLINETWYKLAQEAEGCYHRSLITSFLWNGRTAVLAVVLFWRCLFG